MSTLSGSRAIHPVPDVSGADVERSGRKADLQPRRLERVTDTDDLLAAIRRILTALSRRVGESDIEGLRAMVVLRDDLEKCIADAIFGLRHDAVAPASWSEIGRALGVSHQAAQQRYGHVGGTRRPGGQPGNLR